MTWIEAHPVLFSVVLWPVLTGIVTGLFKPRTPDQYAALPPRVAAFLKLVGALGLDIPKMWEGAGQVLTGKSKPSVAEPVRLNTPIPDDIPTKKTDVKP